MAPSQVVTRGPTTVTLRAIEAVLRKAAAPMSRYEIRKTLGDRVGAPLLDDALDYMADHEMVYDEGPGGKVVWIRGGAKHGRTSPDLAALLRRRRRQILSLASKHGASDVRIFGSVARGQAGPNSDIDVLVRFKVGRTLLDQIGLRQDLEDLLRVKVDVVSEGGLSPYIRDAVLREAVPV